MKRLLSVGAAALTIAFVANPAAARTPIAVRPVPAKASLAIRDKGNGFAIVTAARDTASAVRLERARLGSSTMIDARLLTIASLPRSGRP
jgi:hypothetical protein